MSMRLGTGSGRMSGTMSGRMSTRMSSTHTMRSSTHTLHRMSAMSLGGLSSATLHRRRGSLRPRQKTPSQIFRQICREIMNKKFVPDDRHDIPSRDPSYSKFRVPYAIHCAERYRHSRVHYERQFQHEIKELTRLQPSALEIRNFRRVLNITTRWPPLHNRRELKYTQHHVFPPVNKRRLEYLMITTFPEMTGASGK